MRIGARPLVTSTLVALSTLGGACLVGAQTTNPQPLMPQPGATGLPQPFSNPNQPAQPQPTMTQRQPAGVTGRATPPLDPNAPQPTVTQTRAPVQRQFPPPPTIVPGAEPQATGTDPNNPRPSLFLSPSDPGARTERQRDPGESSDRDDPASLTGPALRGALGVNTPQTPAVAPGTAPAAPIPAQPNFVAPSPGLPAIRTRPGTQGAVRGPAFGVIRPGPDTPAFDPRASNAGPPVVTITAPQRPERPPVDANPFAPLGLRVGNLILRPTLDAGIGVTDNAAQIGTRAFGSSFSRVAPELRVESGWAQHRLTLRGRVDRQDFHGAQLRIPERTDVTFEGSGQLDITRNTNIEAGASFLRRPDPLQGSFTSLVREAPKQDTASANIALNHSFNRFGFRLRGAYDRIDVSDTLFDNGQRQSNRGRNSDVTTGTLRLGYEVSPVLFPYVEAVVTNRTLRNPTPDLGARPGSDALGGRAGIAFTFGALFNGEIAAGLQTTTPRGIPGARPTTTPTVDGVLNWAVSPLTTVRATARTSFTDNPSIGSAGANTYDATIGVSHLLTRNISLDATLGTGFDVFDGISRTDRRTSATFGAVWQFNRMVGLRASTGYTRRESSLANFNSSAFTAEIGLRFQY